MDILVDMNQENFEQVILEGRLRRKREQNRTLAEWVGKLRRGEKTPLPVLNEAERFPQRRMWEIFS